MKEFQSAGLSFIDNLAPMSGIIPWYKFFPTPTSVRFENAVRCLEAIARELAEERMTELKQKIDSGEEFEAISFLDQWLLDDRISREDIFTLMRDFLSAGIDTVSIEIVSSEVRASQLAQACEWVVLQHQLHNRVGTLQASNPVVKLILENYVPLVSSTYCS